MSGSGCCHPPRMTEHYRYPQQKCASQFVVTCRTSTPRRPPGGIAAIAGAGVGVRNGDQQEERDRRSRGIAGVDVGDNGRRHAIPMGVSASDSAQRQRAAAGDHGAGANRRGRGRTAGRRPTPGARCRSAPRPWRSPPAAARGRPPRSTTGPTATRTDDDESAAHLMPELKAQQIELGTRVCSHPGRGRGRAAALAAPGRRGRRRPSAPASPPWPPRRSPVEPIADRRGSGTTGCSTPSG